MEWDPDQNIQVMWQKPTRNYPTFIYIILLVQGIEHYTLQKVFWNSDWVCHIKSEAWTCAGACCAAYNAASAANPSVVQT